MRYFTLSLFLILAASGIQSQIYVKPRLIGTEQYNCNNAVTGSGINLAPECYLFHNSQLSFNNDTINDFCMYGTNYAPDSVMVVLFTIPGYVTYIAVSGPILPVFNYDIIDYVAPSSFTAADGSYVLRFDSIQDPAMLHTYFLEPGSATATSMTWIDDYKVRIDNAKMGSHAFNLTNGSLSYHCQFFIGDNPLLFINGSMQRAAVDVQNADAGCNGIVEVVDVLSSGNYLYEWSIPGVGDSPAAMDVCPGHYNVKITSLDLPDTLLVDFFVFDQEIPFNDNSISGGAFTDTITLVSELCGFNYEFEIDSIYYTSTLLQNWGDSLQYELTMNIYQYIDTTVFIDTFTVTDPNAMVELFLYCDGMKSGFKSQNVNFAFQHSGTLSTATLDEEDFMIYPNPASDYLHVKAKDEVETRIFDVNGRLMQSGKGKDIYVGNLLEGVYFVVVNGESKMHKFVKTND